VEPTSEYLLYEIYVTKLALFNIIVLFLLLHFSSNPWSAMRFMVPTEVTMKGIIFWGVSPCIQQRIDVSKDSAISILWLKIIPSSKQSIETVCSSEISVTLYQTTRCHIPKYSTASIMSYAFISIVYEMWRIIEFEQAHLLL
jgi:hypothetical protein